MARPLEAKAQERPAESFMELRVMHLTVCAADPHFFVFEFICHV